MHGHRLRQAPKKETELPGTAGRVKRLIIPLASTRRPLYFPSSSPGPVRATERPSKGRRSTNTRRRSFQITEEAQRDPETSQACPLTAMQPRRDEPLTSPPALAAPCCLIPIRKTCKSRSRHLSSRKPNGRWGGHCAPGRSPHYSFPIVTSPRPALPIHPHPHADVRLRPQAAERIPNLSAGACGEILV